MNTFFGAATRYSFLSMLAVAFVVITTSFATASNDKFVGKVIKIIDKERSVCEQVDLPFQLDCLRNLLKSAKKKMRSERDFKEASKIFARAEAQIEAVVQANIDPNVKPQRFKGRKLRAIRTDSIKKAERQMRAILKETSDALLRSESRAAKQYVKLAQAVDSNKVLMRS